MNKISLRCLQLVWLVSLVSCGPIDRNEQVDEGSVAGNVYTSDAIGWTIEIPSGLTVVSRNQIEESNERGRDYFEETVGEDFSTKQIRYLINFRKDMFNSFVSTSEQMNVAEQQDYAALKDNVKTVMCETYKKNDVQFHVTDTETVEIGGLEFSTFQFHVHGPGGEILLTQRMYNRLIDGKDFSVAISYNDQACGDEILTAWKNSKFKKK